MNKIRKAYGWLFLSALSVAGLSLSAATVPVTRVGVVNWDCSVPSTTFFGGNVTRVLGPEKWRDRTPYYAETVGKDRIEYRLRSVAEYEREMRYAIDAGIDYFAYCWYDRKPQPPISKNKYAQAGDGHLQELVRARLNHVQSPLREKLHLCAILVTSHGYSDEELVALATEMKNPWYEKAEGRPLVYMFASASLAGRLREICRKEGAPDPYVVAMICEPPAACASSIAGADAVSCYACTEPAGDVGNYVNMSVMWNAIRATAGLPVVPHFATGWDPRPRMETRVPWACYPDKPWAPKLSAADWLDEAVKLRRWIERNPKACPTGHVMAFAWNEFEEGGWICPTLGAAGNRPETGRLRGAEERLDMTRVRAFKAVVDTLKASSGEAGKILQRHDYFTPEALAAADMEGLDAEIATVMSKCDREFDEARKTVEALSGHDRLAVERRLEIAERLKRHVAARAAAAERDEQILAWQGAQDLDSLFGYFRREARRLAERQKASAPTVFDVRDFGATGDGRTDDAPAFRKALEAVAALKGAPTVLKVPAGNYRLGADPRCPCNDFTQHDWQTGDNRGVVKYWSWTKERLHLFLLNLENLVIRGEGPSTVVSFADSSMGGFGFHGCYNTFIEDMTIDYPDNPSTQGTVEAVEDPFALVIRRQDGYPDPDSPRFLNAFSRYFSPLDADGRYRPTGVGRLGTVENLGGGLFRLVPQPRHANDPVWRSMKAGDRMCIVARYAENGGASPVKSVWSAFCGIRNIRFLDSPGQMVWGSGSYAFSVVGCRGTGRDGSDDAVTGNADSILLGGLIGPYVSDCTFRGLEDDGINVSCNTGEVTDIPADRLFRQSHTNGSQPAAGGLLSDGQSAKIKMFLRYAPCRGGDAPGTNCASCEQVATRPMPADVVSAANRGARLSDKLVRVPNTTGAVLRNTEYSGLRGRGIQVHCGNMLVENVRVHDVTGVGISVHALISWSMCYDIYNVLVRNCRFERVGGGHAASTHPEEIASASPMGQRMHFNIAFENCVFDPGAGKTGVYVANADEVRVSGCTFGPGCSDPPVRTNRATRVTVVAADRAASGTRVGVINWDCSPPSDTWFGGYQTRSLSPARYRYLTPYYADVLSPDRISYHRRTPEEYDRELQYAIDAGIDYMAYCWYGEDPTAKRTPVSPGRGASCEDHLHEITWARQFHARSKLRDKLKLCAIFLGNHHYTDAEIDNLARAMGEPWYEKALGRPLCYVFGNGGKALERVRAAALRLGTGDPYMVSMHGAKVPRDGIGAVQALSAYAPPAPPKGGAFLRFPDLFEEILKANESRIDAGFDVIPAFATGRDHWPRIERPVPWTDNPPMRYASPATERELVEAAERFADWIAAHQDRCPTGHVLTYAWNEFEEGAYICPLWTPNGPDVSRLKAFAKVARIFKGERGVVPVPDDPLPDLADLRKRIPEIFKGAETSFQRERFEKKLEAAERLASLPEHTMLMQAELDEFRDYFRRALAHWANDPLNPAVKPVVLDVKDFGAKGDGKTDEIPAFDRAVRAVRALGGKPSVLKVGAGDYLFGAPGADWKGRPANVDFSCVTNCALMGESPEKVRFVYGLYAAHGLSYARSANVTVMNVDCRWAERPFSQTVVESYDPKTCSAVVRWQPGTLKPDDPRYRRAKHTQVCCVFGADGKKVLDRGHSPFFDLRADDLGGGRYRVYFDAKRPGVANFRPKAGDCIILPDRDNACAGTMGYASEFCNFSHVWYRNARSSAISAGGAFYVSASHCRTFPEGEGIVFSSNADTFYNDRGSFLAHCEFHHMCDDGAMSEQERYAISHGLGRVKKAADILYAPLQYGTGFICIGNRIHDLRGCGVNVQCPHSIVESNVIENVSLAMKMTGLTQWFEGTPPYDVVVRGNVFRNCEVGIQTCFCDVNGSVAPEKAIRYLSFEDNRFENVRRPYALMTVSDSTIDGRPLTASPAAGDGLIPFLAITGKPTEAEVRAKVAAIQAQGMESFLVYARSGLELEYMGEAWLKLTEWFCDEAERRSMKVWLYDEYNWPSGTCRGRVPQENDAWRYRELGVFPDGKGGFRWASAFAPAGWVNVCEPAAVDRFMELTHKIYEKRLARWFRNGTILGIFSDEPGHPTRVTFEDGKPLVSFRDYSGLEDEYRAETGRALRADVERYLRDPKENAVWPVYTSLMGRRFRSAYFDRLRAWCDHMGIKLTGHLISENDIAPSAKSNGLPLLCLRGESLPGMDEIRTAFDPDGKLSPTIEWTTYNVARQAVLHRGNGGLVELFACGPADLTPDVLRQLVWMSAFHGIDHYISCMDVMDERGLVEKHGYLSPTGSLHPWYAEHARPLADEARVAAAWARKRVAEREVAVRYPDRLGALAAFAKGNRPNLDPLLQALELNQFTCRLVGEDETTDLPRVFGVAADGSCFEERSGRKGLSPDAAVELCRDLPWTFRVTEADGTPAGDLLVRTYADGSSAVVNMRAEGVRTLVAERACWTSAFRLLPHGVKLFAPGELPPSETASAAVGSLGGDGWTLTVDRDNLLRVNFTPEHAGVVAFAGTVGGVKVVARDYARSYAVTGSGRPIGLNEQAPKGETVLRHEAEPYAFAVDGAALAATGPCGELPQVFASLYRTSAPREFAAGEHAFKIVTGESDRNYFFPALFLSGDFKVRDGKVAPNDGGTVGFGTLAACGYPDFIGKATWSKTVEVPEARMLRLDTGRNVTSVRLNGVELGLKAWGPYEWEIPAELKGRTCRLEVSIWTSANPMFGDEKASGTKWDARFWFALSMPGTACGLLSADWMK